MRTYEILDSKLDGVQGEGMIQHGAGGETWTVRMRKGAKFEDRKRRGQSAPEIRLAKLHLLDTSSHLCQNTFLLYPNRYAGSGLPTIPEKFPISFCRIYAMC
jgi:hypothetical protein